MTTPNVPAPDGEPADAREFSYRTLFEHVPVGLYRTTPAGRIEDANLALARILGYATREELLSVNAIDFYVDPEDRREEQRMMRTAGIIRSYQMRFRRPDGSIIWVEDNCHVIKDADGRVVCHEGSLEDITARKTAEERLLKVNACFLDFGSDPLANIGRLTGLCGELLGADSAMYNRLEGGMLCSWAHWHTPLDFSPVRDPEGHICTDLIKREPPDTVVIRDLHLSEFARTDPDVMHHGLRTYVGQAVQGAEGAVGSLCVVYRRDFVPTADDLSLMKTAAVAIGIEEKRKSAEELTARHARQMAALYDTSLEIGAQREMGDLLVAVVDRAASMVGAPMGGLYLKDDARDDLELVVAHDLPSSFTVGRRVPLGAGVAGRVALSGEPAVFEAGEGASAVGRAEAGYPRGRLLGVPLRAAGKVLGVLVVCDGEGSGSFSYDDLRLVSLFADQAAIALENARLYAATQRELGERRRAEEALRNSEDRYRRLFEDSPVSLWEEDFSELKRWLDGLRAKGIEDLPQYLSERMDELERCASMVRIVDVNRATLDLYAGESKADLVGHLGRLFTPQSYRSFAEEVLALAAGQTQYQGESVNRTLSGASIDVALRTSVAPGHEDTWSKVIVSIMDITQQKKTADRLRYISTHDVLTGLHNRAYFEEEAARIERERRYPLSVIMADVDGLKVTNDTLGHAAGDELLKRAAAVLRAAFRVEDLVARVGGDEFGVLLPGADEHAAADAIRRVRRHADAEKDDAEGAPLSLSIGVATADRANTFAGALTEADARMYADKEQRRLRRQQVSGEAVAPPNGHDPLGDAAPR